MHNFIRWNIFNHVIWGRGVGGVLHKEFT